MASSVTVPVENWQARDWADAISAAWRDGVDAIMQVGNILIRAKEALPHGDFLKMIDTQLPFGKRKAQMLMTIAGDVRLSDAHNRALLPPSVHALYDIAQLGDEQQQQAFEDGTISPDMERSKIATQVKKEKRAAKETNLAAKIPDGKFGVIVADPPWRFEPYSRETGLDRAADNHYMTSEVLEIVHSHPVVAKAADDCVLFLWATVPMLPHALFVMDHWGFDYRSHCIWSKDRVGTGYWFRNAHELLLVGTKGNIPAPAPGTQFPSVIEGRVGKHSAKPECFLEMIETLFPNLPKIELNRRGPARDGWAAWGNEAESGAEIPPATHASSAVSDALMED